MNAKQRRIRYRATMNADPGADTTKTAEGRDYMVSYFLNEYQRGSMVMRFAAPPSDPELYAELRKYGLEASMLKNVSASPVADVKDQGARYAQAQRATEDAQLHTQSLVQHRSPARVEDNQVAANARQYQWNQARATSRNNNQKKGGCFKSLVVIAIVGYVVLATMADESRNDGAFAAIVDVPYEAGFGDKAEACADSLERRAQADLDLYGEDPGLLEDRISTFLPHPANASYLAGCLFN